MKILLSLAFQVLALSAFGQSQTYTSTVTDEQNKNLAYVSVREMGTQNYTTTDKKGDFTLSTQSTNFRLEISSMGFKTKTLRIQNGRFPDKIVLTATSEDLNPIVVTALGIEQKRKALTSSVTELKAEKFTEVEMPNIVNNFAGQVAGVQTTQGSSGVGSSSRILIRGENSLNGRNQALFVVDGIPVRNSQITSNLVNDGSFAEVDYGNGASEISPDDIASVSVLKGAGSAALYGTRAANGVVLISTKDGRQKEEGLGVSIHSTFTVEDLLTLPDYQNKYGGGTDGKYSFKNGKGAGVNDGGISSFGPRLDQGQLIAQFDSPSMSADGNRVRGGDVIARTRADGSLTEITPTPWKSHPDNVRDFFRTGYTSQNNISISSSGENGSSRISYSNLRNQGVLPNTDLKRDGLALSLNQKLNDDLKVDLFANYINSRSGNRPNLGYGYENVMYGFNWTGRQTNIGSLKDYWQAGQVDKQHFDLNYLWLTNPYLTLSENTNSFNKNRFLGNASAVYEFSDKLSLTVRAGLDTYGDKRRFKRAVSTNLNPFGSYREDHVRFKELNTDFLLTYKDTINADLNYKISAGGNRFDQKIDYSYTEAGQLAVPAIYTLANSRTPLKGDSQIFEKKINSLYGSGNLSYKNTYFLDVSFRNDWSSTLPADNNSFAYYSAGLSAVLSDAFTLPEPISYLKLRLSAASVGNDTEPYKNAQNFVFNQNYGPNFRLTNEELLKNKNLKPERLDAFEGGFAAWFFNGRLQLDVSAYQNTSKNQIISRPVSNASGFSNYNVNGGKVRTRGVELSLSGDVLDLDEFKWQSSVNFSSYRSVVTELPGDVDQFVTGSASIFDGEGGANAVFYIAKEGGRVGDMYGTGFKKADGKTVYGENGLPVQDDKLQKLGNYNPDFTLGFRNTFSYKNFDLSVLFDWRSGGTIVSRTKALGSTSGVLKETLQGRKNGIVGDGVVNVGTSQNPNYQPNTTAVSASQYYNNYYDRGNEASALYDASYLKLRQVSLYYSFTEKYKDYLGVDNLKIGVIGSNLLLFTANPHFDPELSTVQGRDMVYGVEDFSYPSTRSYGLSIKTNF